MASHWDWLHIIREVGLDLPGWIVFIRDIMGDRVKKQIKERMNADYRGEAMTVIFEMTGKDDLKVKAAAEVLLGWLRIAKTQNIPEIEDNVMYALGNVIPYGGDDKMELEKAIRIFTAIGNRNADDFAVFVAAMRDEWINQHVGPLVRKFGADPLMWAVGYISVFGPAAFRATIEKLTKLGAGIADKAREADAATDPTRQLAHEFAVNLFQIQLAKSRRRW